ncbi:NAD(P)-dependent oxidoreductase [Maritimibacter sp. HL-12]|uniref:NAD-dependent epimerase/dehydratase family protein n=1 Tax=Maritimibacter sp. HL-12 TaxID=1162418 RepID=UPI000A0F28D3|nr:NAD(P)-dependent oxidoreductase [Maritimibacter sp. HL-12]SMH52697.1 Nucleoside-diphosphate-sugar epimerase [Maritimibacter sp. HL-12]
MRILFTGGSGKAGREVIPYLIERGHSVMNVDLKPLDLPGVDNITADITDSGQIFNAASMYANFGELEPGTGVPRFDAVVHFAAIARILLTPDNECYRVNVIGTYNVLEAALKLGVRKVVIASSETTYGVCFADGEKKPLYLPVDEDHPTVPEDSYGMSKVVNEVTARSFAERTGADVYALRINNVMSPEDYARDWPAYFANPDLRRRNIFSYIDARDLGQIVDLCLHKDGLGYQVFNAANDGMSVALTPEEVVARYYEGVELREPPGNWTTPYSNRKIREVLGFEEQHPWTRYVNP